MASLVRSLHPKHSPANPCAPHTSLLWPLTQYCNYLLTCWSPPLDIEFFSHKHVVLVNLESLGLKLHQFYTGGKARIAHSLQDLKLLNIALCFGLSHKVHTLPGP